MYMKRFFKAIYTKQVPEIVQEPNYEAAPAVMS